VTTGRENTCHIGVSSAVRIRRGWLASCLSEPGGLLDWRCSGNRSTSRAAGWSLERRASSGTARGLRRVSSSPAGPDRPGVGGPGGHRSASAAPGEGRNTIWCARLHPAQTRFTGSIRSQRAATGGRAQESRPAQESREVTRGRARGPAEAQTDSSPDERRRPRLSGHTTPSFFIRNRSVFGWMPRRSALLPDPLIRQPHRSRTLSICAR
jgi:hypothetical protein